MKTLFASILAVMMIAMIMTGCGEDGATDPAVLDPPAACSVSVTGTQATVIITEASPTEGVEGYILEDDTDVPLDSILATETEFAAVTIDPAMDTVFYVFAYDADGNVSEDYCEATYTAAAGDVALTTISLIGATSGDPVENSAYDVDGSALVSLEYGDYTDAAADLLLETTASSGVALTAISSVGTADTTVGMKFLGTVATTIDSLAAMKTALAALPIGTFPATAAGLNVADGWWTVGKSVRPAGATTGARNIAAGEVYALHIASGDYYIVVSSVDATELDAVIFQIIPAADVM